MSTLAICGVNKDKVKFRETSLNVGQKFQNGYGKLNIKRKKLLIVIAWKVIRLLYTEQAMFLVIP